MGAAGTAGTAISAANVPAIARSSPARTISFTVAIAIITGVYGCGYWVD